MLNCSTMTNCFGETEMRIRLTERQFVDFMDFLERSSGRPMKTLDQIITCKDVLDSTEQQAIVDEVINLLRSKHITYACAYNIMTGVADALAELSQQLPM